MCIRDRTGSFGKRPKIALTGMGSEHGEENSMAGALMAQAKGIDVVYIGSIQDDRVTCVKVGSAEECHATMEKMVNNHEVDGAVTMHYPFPIGVSTVGRCITPGRGKAMYLANTTGTSSTDRVEGMIKNAIYGIITAKACGIAKPTIGIANIDGARQTEAALKELQANGYDINFATSERADGGCVMRGNDILTGTPDIMVMDSLTGNILVKMLAAFNSGGSYEASGWGYGPGIGEGYDPLVKMCIRDSNGYGEYLHLGSTTQDVSDTGFMMLLKRSYEAIMKDLRDVEAAALKLAADHKNTVMAGRTHGQQALPITFGFKAAYWASEIRREIERMKEVYARDFVGELSGAVGTCAGFGKDGHVISEEAIARLGLDVYKRQNKCKAA